MTDREGVDMKKRNAQAGDIAHEVRLIRDLRPYLNVQGVRA